MGLHHRPLRPADLAAVLRHDCTASGGTAVPALFDVLAEKLGNDDLRMCVLHLKTIWEAPAEVHYDAATQAEKLLRDTCDEYWAH